MLEVIKFKLDIEPFNTNVVLFSDGFGNTVRLMLVLIVGCKTNQATKKTIKMIALWWIVVVINVIGRMYLVTKMLPRPSTFPSFVSNNTKNNQQQPPLLRRLLLQHLIFLVTFFDNFLFEIIPNTTIISYMTDIDNRVKVNYTHQ